VCEVAGWCVLVCAGLCRQMGASLWFGGLGTGHLACHMPLRKQGSQGPTGHPRLGYCSWVYFWQC
jgi:hypothetical protein